MDEHAEKIVEEIGGAEIQEFRSQLADAARRNNREKFRSLPRRERIPIGCARGRYRGMEMQFSWTFLFGSSIGSLTAFGLMGRWGMGIEAAVLTIIFGALLSGFRNGERTT
jgi:hypothetical protein